jgi:hypothetical protein
VRISLAAATLLALLSFDASADSARGQYRSTITDIESGHQAARRACAPMTGDARATCLRKADEERSASRARAGLRLKSADAGRNSGREIMGAHQEAVAAADRRDHDAARARCDAMSAGERLPCTSLAKAAYRY